MTNVVTTVQAQAAKYSLYSAILFVIFLLLLHILEPEFAPAWHFISEFELGNFGWLMQLTFVLLAVSLISISIALFNYARSMLGYIGLAIMLISAFGLIMAGIFTTDPGGTSQTAMTFHGKIHVFGASLNLFPLAAILLTIRLSRQAAWRQVRKWLILTTVIIILANIGFIASFPHDGKFGPETITGLVGRLFLLSYIPWLVIVARKIGNLYKSQSK